MSTKFDAKRDPPSSNERSIQHSLERFNGDEKENSNSSRMAYSAIRFSDELEVYSKQPSQNRSTTPTKSILRKNEPKKVSRRPSKRRDDSLLKKIQRTIISQAQDEMDSLRKLEPPGPVLRRQDWNMESLFTPSGATKELSKRQLVKRSRRDEDIGSPTQIPKNEQYYSSEYLLKKYAVISNDSAQSNMGVLDRDKLDLDIYPSPSMECAIIRVPDTPKGRGNLQEGPFSDSKLNEKTTARRRLLGRKIKKNKLSYLQLEEGNSNKLTVDVNDCEIFAEESVPRKDSKVNKGYDHRSFVQQIPVVISPRSSIASYDDLLLQKVIINMDNRKSGKIPGRFDWDALCENSPHHFDDTDFEVSSSHETKTICKVWAIWVLVGAVFVCIASSLTIYLTMMENEGIASTSFDQPFFDNFGMGECKNHNYNNSRYVSDRYDTIRNYLKMHSTGDVAMMDQPGSPQREALCWISEFDDYHINGGNEEAITQRYSLAVMYFALIERSNIFDHSSSGREKIIDNNFGSLRTIDFLSPQHECDWDAIMCNSSRSVTILRLSKKSLTGNLPPEIGNLRSLSE